MGYTRIIYTKRCSILSINTSEKRGRAKDPVESVMLRKNWGFIGDAHAQEGMKQVSMLAVESVERKQATVTNGTMLVPGSFGENITTQGINIVALPIGTKLYIADSMLEISRIGKYCHKYCSIYYKIGDCIMPREGVFARVIIEGEIHAGDDIRVVYVGDSIDNHIVVNVANG